MHRTSSSALSCVDNSDFCLGGEKFWSSWYIEHGRFVRIFPVDWTLYRLLYLLKCDWSWSPGVSRIFIRFFTFYHVIIFVKGRLCRFWLLLLQGLLVVGNRTSLWSIFSMWMVWMVMWMAVWMAVLMVMWMAVSVLTTGFMVVMIGAGFVAAWRFGFGFDFLKNSFLLLE